MLSGQRQGGSVDDKKLGSKETSMIMKSNQYQEKGLIITSVQTEACVVRRLMENCAYSGEVSR